MGGYHPARSNALLIVRSSSTRQDAVSLALAQVEKQLAMCDRLVLNKVIFDYLSSLIVVTCHSSCCILIRSHLSHAKLSLAFGHQCLVDSKNDAP